MADASRSAAGCGNAAQSARSPAHPGAVAGRNPPPTTIERSCIMTDPDLAALRERADNGSAEAADELIELAGERGDIDELRRLSDRGNGTATEGTPMRPTSSSSSPPSAATPTSCGAFPTAATARRPTS